MYYPLFRPNEDFNHFFTMLGRTKKTVEEAGAIIINQARFKGFFKPKLTRAFLFGQYINEQLI